MLPFPPRDPGDIAPKIEAVAPLATDSMWNQPGVAEAYSRFAQAAWYNAINCKLLELAPPAAGDSVLEVGCGVGSATKLLAQRVGALGNVHALDASPHMIAAARQSLSEHTNTQFEVADVSLLNPALLHSCNGVYAFNAIHLFPNVEHFLRQCHIGLRPGSRVAFCTGFCSDAVSPADMPTATKFVRALLSALRSEGLRASPQFSGMGEPRSSSQYGDLIAKVGFTIWRMELVRVEIPAAAMLDFASVPGSVGDLLPSQLSPERRAALFERAFNSSGLSCLPRHWMFLVAER